MSAVELDPWGGDTARSNNEAFQPRRVTTYDRDGNASDEAMHRRYNRWHLRFDQPDPHGGSYDITNPQSFNRYSYVLNDPVNFVDPLGLDPDFGLGPPPPVPTLVPPSGPLDTVTINTSAPHWASGGGSLLGGHFVPETGPEENPDGGVGGGTEPQNPVASLDLNVLNSCLGLFGAKIADFKKDEPFVYDMNGQGAFFAQNKQTGRLYAITTDFTSKTRAQLGGTGLTSSRLPYYTSLQAISQVIRKPLMLHYWRPKYTKLEIR